MSTKSKNEENATTHAKVWHKQEELKWFDHHHEWRCHIHTKSENKTITKHDVNFKPYKPNPKQSTVNHINNAGAHLCSNGSHATCARWNDLDTLRIWKTELNPNRCRADRRNTPRQKPTSLAMANIRAVQIWLQSVTLQRQCRRVNDCRRCASRNWTTSAL